MRIRIQDQTHENPDPEHCSSEGQPNMSHNVRHSVHYTYIQVVDEWMIKKNAGAAVESREQEQEQEASSEMSC